MSDHGNQYTNHQRAAELHEVAAHAHRVAEDHRGKQDHLSAQELSRQSLEHSRAAHEHSMTLSHASHGMTSFGHKEIAARAHELWIERGSPHGSPDEDWFRAAAELRAGHQS